MHLKSKYALFIGTLTVITLLAVSNESRAKQVQIKCPEIVPLMDLALSKPQVWRVVSNIRVRTSGVSRKFENFAVKKFYENRTIDKSEFNTQLPKFEQKGCEQVNVKYPGGYEVSYKVKYSTPFRMTLYRNESEEDLTVKVRRLGGHKILEFVHNVPLVMKEDCNGKEKVESHVVEVTSLLSWTKPIPQKRVMQDDLLRLLSQDFEDSKTGAKRSIAGCVTP